MRAPPGGRVAGVACLVLAGAAASVIAAQAAVAVKPGPAAARVFARRLAASGRATATIERVADDPIAGRPRAIRGRIALEPPDRALLEFPATREKLALRADGGEWLQPALRQMLRLGPRNAASARRWWELLLPGGGRFAERALSSRRYAIASPAAEDRGADTAWVELDARGLPIELAFEDASGNRVSYRFSGWRFGPARGPAAFTLEAPGGFEVVDLP
jgi:hypothetical protein